MQQTLKPAKLPNGWWAHFKRNSYAPSAMDKWIVSIGKHKNSNLYDDFVGLFPTKAAALKYIRRHIGL